MCNSRYTNLSSEFTDIDGKFKKSELGQELAIYHEKVGFTEFSLYTIPKLFSLSGINPASFVSLQITITIFKRRKNKVSCSYQ